MLTVFETWKLNEYLHYDYINIVNWSSKLSLCFLLPDTNTISPRPLKGKYSYIMVNGLSYNSDSSHYKIVITCHVKY